VAVPRCQYDEHCRWYYYYYTIFIVVTLSKFTKCYSELFMRRFVAFFAFLELKINCSFEVFLVSWFCYCLQKPLVSSHDLLYFADICAGPGGFSEYVLWRRGCDAKGFGFTLKGSNDFKLEDFFAAPCELFEPHYGTDCTESSLISFQFSVLLYICSFGHT